MAIPGHTHLLSLTTVKPSIRGMVKLRVLCGSESINCRMYTCTPLIYYIQSVCIQAMKATVNLRFSAMRYVQRSHVLGHIWI